MKRIVQRVREGGVHLVLLACAMLSVLTTAGIIYVLVRESYPFFRDVPVFDYLLGTVWIPDVQPPRFGVLPLAAGTTVIAVGALALSLPIGLATALFLSEYAPPGVRQTLKPLLEVLAGIPSVVYGYFALTFVTPHLLQPLLPGTQIFNAGSAAIVVAIMVLPMIASLCDDALRAVPRSLRDGAYALAATKFEVSLRVVLPAALSGVVAAVLLAFARAIGETMAVAIAAGMRPTLTLDPRQPMQTMTGFIVQTVQGYMPQGSLGYQSLFAVGLTLFAVTLTINLIARRVMKHFREAYE
jgi:phosphate transport system permease protein